MKNYHSPVPECSIFTVCFIFWFATVHSSSNYNTHCFPFKILPTFRKSIKIGVFFLSYLNKNQTKTKCCVIHCTMCITQNEYIKNYIKKSWWDCFRMSHVETCSVSKIRNDFTAYVWHAVFYFYFVFCRCDCGCVMHSSIFVIWIKITCRHR